MSLRSHPCWVLGEERSHRGNSPVDGPEVETTLLGLRNRKKAVGLEYSEPGRETADKVQAGARSWRAFWAVERSLDFILCDGSHWGVCFKM